MHSGGRGGDSSELHARHVGMLTHRNGMLDMSRMLDLTRFF